MTIVYVNGINTTIDQAGDDIRLLRDNFIKRTGDKRTVFLNGYNQTHLEGVGDKIKAFWQDGFSEEAVWTDFDLKTILINLHEDLTTQKVLLVGHSQGSYYANQMYTYLTSHGVDKQSTAVFNVATPARFVSGGGAHLNSTTDSLLNELEATHLFKPLYRNIDLSLDLQDKDLDAFLTDALDSWTGHSFGKAYLALAPGTVISMINGGLGKLTAESEDKEVCFTPPQKGLAYEAQKALFAVADPAAVGVKVAAVEGFNGAALAVGGVKSGLAAVGSFFGSVANAVIPKARIENLPGSYDIVKGIYGSSASEAELNDLLGNNQSGSVALAVQKPEPKKTQPQAKEDQAGEVQGMEIEKPAEPLIPIPKMAAVASPGFGGGGGAVPAVEAPSTSGDTPAPPPPAPASAEPDGAPPTVVTVTVNGQPLLQTAPFAETPAATSTTLWSVVVTFDKDIGIAPTAKDGTPGYIDPVLLIAEPFGDGVSQTVSNCADADLKTFCFTYVPLPDQETAVFWFFRIAGAADVSGEYMATTTYRFIRDTAGPILAFDTPFTNAALPVLRGSSTFGGAPITLAFNSAFYTLQASGGVWSLELTGPDLAEGVYPLVASSTDQFGNNGPILSATLTVDMTLPAVAIAAPAGDMPAASTTPVVFEFSATDNNSGVRTLCKADEAPFEPCTAPYSAWFASGSHIFTVLVIDAADNAVTSVRSFTVE